MQKNNSQVAQRKHFRIESEIMNYMNYVMKNEIYDENVKKATITYVKLTKPRDELFVYIDTYDRTKIDFILKCLNEAKPAFKRALASHLNLRKIPNIFFERDLTIDRMNEMEELFDKINNKNK
ncbi:MAG: 30S ribosome-binding factor RbfA [Mycoplasmataceae bacterium]|jgi:ribosome-binding factor A|nr:30S ribosome-binding factor RbfA [Mycoplasmataceae bacterium]